MLAHWLMENGRTYNELSERQSFRQHQDEIRESSEKFEQYKDRLRRSQEEETLPWRNNAAAVVRRTDEAE